MNSLHRNHRPCGYDEIYSGHSAVDLNACNSVMTKLNGSPNSCESLADVCAAVKGTITAACTDSSKLHGKTSKPSESSEIIKPDPLIYVVDDDNTVRRIVKMIVKRGIRGSRIEDFEDAKDAFAKLSNGGEMPDLVISDIEMTYMDGDKLCKAIGTLDKPNKPPVVLITGSIEDEVHERAWRSGASELIKKPFNAKDLISAAKYALMNNCKS